MPLQYTPDKFAFFTEGDSLTEQEHKDSCDINKMLKNAARGFPIQTNPAQPVYGYDDTTLDGVTHRINKQKIETDLTNLAKTTELTEDELKLIPKSVQQKFNFKVKKRASKNDDSNDDTKKPVSDQKSIKTEPTSKSSNEGPSQAL